MNGKQILESIINNEEFNLKAFESFFRQKNDKLRFPDVPLPAPEQTEDFSGGRLLAEGQLDDGKLIVCSFLVNKELTERSGKKAQYAVGKRILKEQLADAGIFIFYDEKGNFRFSLIYTNYLGKTRDWSTFKRFTYFVSKELTNKTFLGQIGEGDLSTIEKIKEAFSVEKVTKEFYSEIANWYFWAVKKVTFPPDAEKEENGRNIAVIRMITRIIFVWFMKEKGLVPPQLFNKKQIGALLTDISPNESTYYKAILQNLFFATLNTKMKDRKFRFQTTYQGKNNSYMVHTVYRYEKYFKDKDSAISLFKDIPFLNGGLFDCLDRRIEENGRNKEIRIDGFSDKEVGLSIPNVLFFSDEKQLDLNKEYGTHNKKYKVTGLIDLLSSYNFTIDENVPDDQEVALDPELLGKVFENLLASYNPETATTARKATGSYYTPREIVDYMVTESLKQYLQTSLDGIDSIEEKLEWLFSPDADKNINPFDVDTTKKIVALIDSLRIVDPAVGSGAFPMGVLNKLVFILSKLDPENQLWKETQLKAIEMAVTDPVLKNKLKEQAERQFLDKNSDYGRKLYLIQRCIYGVDIQQIAVEVAKLRFFISLLVDEKVNKDKSNWGIEPLPNLDFKIMQGDSLTSKFMGIDLDEETISDESPLFANELSSLIDDFQSKKSQFQNESDKRNKDDLMQEINEFIIKIFELKLKTKKRSYFEKIKIIEETCSNLPNETQRKEAIEIEKNKLYEKEGFNLDQAEKQLKEYTQGQKTRPFFPWKLYFAEVFQEKGGFDIVIGNPPYIQLQKAYDSGRKYADLYKNQDYETFDRMGDIYCLFYERGIRILRRGGILTYISSNKWMRAGYGQKLRQYFLKLNPKILIDLGPGVFESSTVDTNILIIQKATNEKKLVAAKITENKKGHVDFAAILKNNGVVLSKLDSQPWFIGNDAEQRLKEKIERVGKPLREWNVNIYYGIKTGLNEAFIIDEAKRQEILNNCQDEDERRRTEAIIKPILRGRDIKRYYYEWAGFWLIGTFPALHIDIEDYPAIKKYFLDNFDVRQLEQSGKKYPKLRFNARKKTSNKWYETQDQIAYYQEFEKEKVVWTPVNSEYSFAIIPSGIYFLNSVFMITGSEIKLFCALFNSTLIRYYLIVLFSSEEEYTYASKQNMEKIPIPRITSFDSPIIKQIEELVDKIILAKKQNLAADTAHWEQEIDNLVYNLYGLTDEDIKIIKNSTKKSD